MEVNYNKIKWVATIMFVCAGTLISLNIEISKWAFPLFTLGHIILIPIFWKQRDMPLVTQNFFFLLIDLLGVYRWLI